MKVRARTLSRLAPALVAALAYGLGGALVLPVAAQAQTAPGATISAQDAERFLQQATFGYSDADIALVQSIGYSAWIDKQFAMPVQYSHLDAYNSIFPTIKDSNINPIHPGMWIGFTKDDQLRQRYLFAISQILVNSTYVNATQDYGRAMARYVDILQTTGLTTFGELLTQVSLSPAMGAFLSNLYNRGDSSLPGTQPDQNYAREVMQLFSIGLWQLNPDGSRKLDANGQPIPTYTQADVVGISKALTGFGLKGATADDWEYTNCFCQPPAEPAVQMKPMEGNNSYHSSSEKKFLGVTIKAGATKPITDLKVVMNRLVRHPNVGPFIGRQLIQRFVTSNPSPAYIARVSAVFDNNGAGVRGDMKAVIKAILLDPEARDPAKAADPTFGRIREPIQRYAQILRVFNAKPGDDPNDFGIPTWDYDSHKGLWQSPLHAHTVFNFYYPDYKPAGTELFKRELVSPEMQITTAASVGDIDDFMWNTLLYAGLTKYVDEAHPNAITLQLDYSDWLPLVRTPTALIEKMNQRFMAGQMSAALKRQIRDSMAAITDDWAQTSGGLPQLKFARAMRVMIASAEYVVQK
ncbi:hypothetical protein AQZ52_01730 [Novosphingobium fuchskuhlense]|uniref:DUF1800 domain-containing protein n=1 Tax=Novosphingobium fuchskuhlense TaxID=1117702 RepID=A0A124JWV1_9SPHN|nr:DUF1800 family protein [Novosphingobium fuchskuhlense]KUR73714.1 hypothetical protein AQZ52_01730 [Novosphingobium fuchskuhlense]